jgi:hypothetical protein
MESGRDIDRSLSAVLQALAEDEAAVGASPRVQDRLRDEVRRIKRARRRAVYAGLGFAAASSLVVLSGYHRVAPATTPRSATIESTRESLEIATEFFPLPYSTVPVGDAQIVRLELPRSALAAVGLASRDLPTGEPSDSVQADVIVGEDGLARAVRFVRPLGAEERP